jgi:hypothetical protein
MKVYLSYLDQKTIGYLVSAILAKFYLLAQTEFPIE